MSFSLGGNLSPLPVSTSTRCPPVSTSRQRVLYSQRLSGSHDTSFDHSVFGTTPCIAPPSRRKFPPLRLVMRRSPSASTPTILARLGRRARGRRFRRRRRDTDGEWNRRRRRSRRHRLLRGGLRLRRRRRRAGLRGVA